MVCRRSSNVFCPQLHIKWRRKYPVKQTVSFLKGSVKVPSSSHGTVHSDYRTVSPYWVLPVYVELIRAVWADDGDRPLLFWQYENLVQNQLFALTKLNIYKTNCLKISSTTPAAVQKKGTLNKKSMKLWFVKT
jgi:hypothetical protein